MKAVTRLLLRHEARAREAEELRAFRGSHTMSFPGHGRLSSGPQLPLSFAPYRLQAADRWWQESTTPDPNPSRKRRT